MILGVLDSIEIDENIASCVSKTKIFVTIICLIFVIAVYSLLLKHDIAVKYEMKLVYVKKIFCSSQY